MNKAEAIEQYKQAVLRMYRFVSPEVSHTDFHDAVNAVILARAELCKHNVDIKKIKWT